MQAIRVQLVEETTRWARAKLLRVRNTVIRLVDLAAWFLGFIVTARISLGPNGVEIGSLTLLWFGLIIFVSQMVIGEFFGLYRGRFRVGGQDEAIALATTWLAVALITSGFELALAPHGRWLAETPALFRSSVALTLMAAARLGWRILVERTMRPNSDNCKRAVIIGAGEGGYLIIRGMLTDPTGRYLPVAIVDDDVLKARRSLMGIKVAGTIDDLPAVIDRHVADVVVIAIPSASSSLIRKIVDTAKTQNVEVRTVPSTSEIAGTLSLGDVRPINANDLLGRAEVQVDLDQIRRYLSGRRVLVTGAGGSIGSELCRQLHHLQPAKLLMLDRDESGLHATQLGIEGRALLDTPALILADIRDRDRTFQVFEEWRPEVVFHAAALKHLTLLEQHPGEGVKTNVFGTQNVIDAAMACGADCVVNVSTDKAADPTSVLGATKLLAEQVAAETARRTGARVVSVRFGNVLGSRGSVLPTFLEQIAAGGPVTVTDPDVTRYFMTIPEAVRLVLQAGAIGRPGETLILDMGRPVRIVDLANRLIAHHDPSVTIEFTGLRPGEKLHEQLVANDEWGTTREHPRIMHTESEMVVRLDDLKRLEGRDDINSDDLTRMARRPERQLSAEPLAP